jgi:hypothetical protein
VLACPDATPLALSAVVVYSQPVNDQQSQWQLKPIQKGYFVGK